jgi:phosphoadenosine phosphosulfate reductase
MGAAACGGVEGLNRVPVSAEDARAVAARLERLDAATIVASAIRDIFPGRIALVSSFGAEAAVLLHMVARVDTATPVLFVDTGKLFGETLRYRDRLAAELGLRDLRILRADAAAVAKADPDGTLWRDDPDRCCAVRKVTPLEGPLAAFDAWINGRKRHHGGVRAELPIAERDGDRVKLNPLAAWTASDVDDYFQAWNLPRHPLVEDGFASIGCIPCTARIEPGEDARAGRWRGLDKTECGIHHAPAARPE